MINWNDSALDIYIWDVGHGLSITIITPYVDNIFGSPFKRRRVIQVDAGSNDPYGFSPIKHLVNNLGLSDIDHMFITHADQDHINDLPNAFQLVNEGKLNIHTFTRNRSVPDIILSEDPTKEKSAKTIYKHLNQTYIAPVPMEHLFLPQNFGGVEVNSTFLSFLEGKTLNNTSLVVEIKFGTTQFIIPGDLEEEGAALLIDSGRMFIRDMNRYRILVAPHHGSSTAKPAKLLGHLHPHKVLASVEENHELTDPLYSSPDYVLGHEIELFNGEKVIRRFTGTKGQLIHLKTYGHIPMLKKISYDKYKQPIVPPYSDLLSKIVGLPTPNYSKSTFIDMLMKAKTDK